MQNVNYITVNYVSQNIKRGDEIMKKTILAHQFVSKR